MSDSSENCLPSITSRIGKRWITVGFGFLGLLNAYGMRICLSIAITEMTFAHHHSPALNNSDETCNEKQHNNVTKIEPVIHSDAIRYNWSEHTQGLILSSFYWGYVMTSLFGGVICRKLGGKYALGLGILFTSIFTLLTPYCVRWGGSTGLIIFRAATGFGEGTTYPAIAHLLAHWIPEDERSKAGTVVFSGTALGIIFAMLISGAILQHSKVGWPMVFYFYGSFGLISSLLTLAFCYSRPCDDPHISKEELTYLENKIRNTHKNIPATPWRHILKSPAFWAATTTKFGSGWIYFTVVSDLPKYMSSVLKFSAMHNGFFSSIPHLSMWAGATLTCWIADKVIKDKTMSITNVRKIGCTAASLGPAIFLIAASYAGCDGVLVIALQSAGLAFMGCSFFSVLINVLDLSPNYASSLMGVGNGIGVISGMLAPYVVGVLTPNQTISEWRLVFWIVFVIAVISSFIFVIFGSGDVQEWNNPDFLNEKHVKEKSVVKEGLRLLTVNKH